MGRDPRAFTQPWRLVEVTAVTIQNRYLLRPSPELNDLILGILGRAQRQHEMTVVSVTFLSSHFHALLYARDAEHLAKFMEFVNTNLSKEAGKLHDWPGTMFPHRYHHVEVSDDEADQVARLKYCLSNGVKEFLVDRVGDWPGVHSGEALVTGAPLSGRWYDRTRQHAARQLQLQGEKYIDTERFATVEHVVLSPLPCWAPLPEPVWRQRVAELIEEVDREAAVEREQTGRRSRGAKKVLAMHPHYRPPEVEASAKPRFHARKPSVWKRLWEAWREILAAFREASARFLSGELSVEFPEGTFPPHAPFVPFAETLLIDARGQPV